jgi:hypothetical protein
MRERAARAPWALAIAFAAGTPACAARAPHALPDPGCRPAATLAFAADSGAADEDYVCFGFDASAVVARTIARVVWIPATGGPNVLHHTKLYAVPDDFPDGPVVCRGMPPGAVGGERWEGGKEEKKATAAKRRE